MKKNQSQTGSRKEPKKTFDEEISEILQNCEYLSQFIVNEKTPLGKGSFGIVFSIKRKKDGKEFALKILLKDTEFQEKKDEIFLMYSLKDNPHILKIFGDFIDPKENLGFLLLEKADMSLQNLIDPDPNPSDMLTLKSIFANYPSVFDLKYLLQMILDILTGLKYALEEKKYSHSDIKPSNIFVFFNINRDEMEGVQQIFTERKKHLFKLGDWGNGNVAGRSIDQTTQMSKFVGGTEKYIAPEILNEKQQINLAKADIYSFGLTIFACCGADSKEFKSLNHMTDELDHQNYLEKKLEKYQIKNRYGEGIENLLRNMIKFNSKERMGITQIFELLNKIMRKIKKYNKNEELFEVSKQKGENNESEEEKINTEIKKDTNYVKTHNIDTCEICFTPSSSQLFKMKYGDLLCDSCIKTIISEKDYPFAKIILNTFTEFNEFFLQTLPKSLSEKNFLSINISNPVLKIRKNECGLTYSACQNLILLLNSSFISEANIAGIKISIDPPWYPFEYDFKNHKDTDTAKNLLECIFNNNAFEVFALNLKCKYQVIENRSAVNLTNKEADDFCQILSKNNNNIKNIYLEFKGEKGALGITEHACLKLVDGIRKSDKIDNIIFKVGNEFAWKGNMNLESIFDLLRGCKKIKSLNIVY